MAVSLKHTTQAVGTDAGNGEIRKAQWNEEHTLTAAADTLLGAVTTGAVTEITCTAAGRALLDDADASAQRTTLGLGTGNSPQFTTIELGNASDTTISRSAAGVIAVEGGVIPKENRANTFAAQQTISAGILNISAADAAQKRVSFQTAGTARWTMGSDETAESGSNAGSNFFLYRLTDAGAFIANTFNINRATGLTTLEGLTVTGGGARKAKIQAGAGTEASLEISSDTYSTLNASGGGPLAFQIAGVEAVRLDTAKNLLMKSTGGLGYGTGSGGTVTQATSKSTGVTLNKATGRITTASDALAAGASVFFRVTCSAVTTSDFVGLSLLSVTSGNGNYEVSCVFVGAGIFDIKIKNVSTGSLSEELRIQFVVIKGAIS